MLRQANGEDVPAVYAGRLKAMAGFTVASSREDGSSPWWGDADDARVLPFGGQKLGDHRYLVGMVAMALDDTDIAARFHGSRSELIWVFGPDRVAAFPSVPAVPAVSTAFTQGGVYIMRQGNTHVFIDCGPIGLAGRGGHGHNDALSFEAWIDGVPLVIDRGSFVYTASFEKRNEFRSTTSHNTPCVDGEEINRFDPKNLWAMQNDAHAECKNWQSDVDEDLFTGLHHGYRRRYIGVERRISLRKQTRVLEIVDSIEGRGDHHLTVPLHLAPCVTVQQFGNELMLISMGRKFSVRWQGEGWALEIEQSTISPSYGIVQASRRLVWKRSAGLPAWLAVVIEPVEVDS